MIFDTFALPCQQFTWVVSVYSHPPLLPEGGVCVVRQAGGEEGGRVGGVVGQGAGAAGTAALGAVGPRDRPAGGAAANCGGLAAAWTRGQCQGRGARTHFPP